MWMAPRPARRCVASASPPTSPTSSCADESSGSAGVLPSCGNSVDRPERAVRQSRHVERSRVVRVLGVLDVVRVLLTGPLSAAGESAPERRSSWSTVPAAGCTPGSR